MIFTMAQMEPMLPGNRYESELAGICSKIHGVQIGA